MIETLQKLVPALVDLQPIPKAILSVLIVVLGAFCLAVLWIQPTKKDGAAAKPELGKLSSWANGQWPQTGDFVIDQTIERVNRLKKPNPSDAEIVSALQPIFHKPIFLHVREEPDPGRALFTFCKAQQLLTVYQLKISSPSIRDSFGRAIPNLINLQDRLGALYGPTFRRDISCDEYSATMDEYLSHLPSRTRERLADDEFTVAMARLQSLQSILAEAGLR